MSSHLGCYRYFLIQMRNLKYLLCNHYILSYSFFDFSNVKIEIHLFIKNIVSNISFSVPFFDSLHYFILFSWHLAHGYARVIATFSNNHVDFMLVGSTANCSVIVVYNWAYRLKISKLDQNWITLHQYHKFLQEFSSLLHFIVFLVLLLLVLFH